MPETHYHKNAVVVWRPISPAAYHALLKSLDDSLESVLFGSATDWPIYVATYWGVPGASVPTLAAVTRHGDTRHYVACVVVLDEEG